MHPGLSESGLAPTFFWRDNGNSTFFGFFWVFDKFVKFAKIRVFLGNSVNFGISSKTCVLTQHMSYSQLQTVFDRVIEKFLRLLFFFYSKQNKTVTIVVNYMFVSSLKFFFLKKFLNIRQWNYFFIKILFIKNYFHSLIQTVVSRLILPPESLVEVRVGENGPWQRWRCTQR